MVEGVYDVKLYPEEGETTTTLNIKRGIISALAVPLLEEQKNKIMVRGINQENEQNSQKHTGSGSLFASSNHL